MTISRERATSEKQGMRQVFPATYSVPVQRPAQRPAQEQEQQTGIPPMQENKNDLAGKKPSRPLTDRVNAVSGRAFLKDVVWTSDGPIYY